MAQKVQVLLLDDLDGGSADETVTFGLDGVSYEIDLSSANAQKLRNALSKYVESGRRAKRGRRGPGGPRGGRGDTSAVREWARGQGLKVSDRGRIPADIMAQYDAANK